MNDEQRLQAALEALNPHADHQARRAALQVIAELKAARAIPDLLNVLHDRDRVLQAMAVRVLAEVGGPLVVPDLLEMLHGDDAGVVKEAIAALGRIKHPDAVLPLLEVLQAKELRALFDKERGQPDSFEKAVILGQFAIEISSLRAEAARALGAIGDARAVPGLVEALFDGHITSVNEAAAVALERIGTPQALAAVAEWRHTRR